MVGVGAMTVAEGAWKLAKPGVGQRFGDASAGPNVFRKTGMITRREDALCLQAVAPRQPADRALGGDVDMVGRRLLDPPGDLVPAW